MIIITVIIIIIIIRLVMVKRSRKKKKWLPVSRRTDFARLGWRRRSLRRRRSNVCVWRFVRFDGDERVYNYNAATVGIRALGEPLANHRRSEIYFCERDVTTTTTQFRGQI